MNQLRYFKINITFLFFVFFTLVNLTIILISNNCNQICHANVIALNDESRTFVLSIGIANFQDQHWDNLKFTAKDAFAFDKFFKNEAEKEHKSQWRELLVANKEKNNYVSDKDILEALNRLKNDNRLEQDIVIVYVSTHGTIYENPNTGKLGRYIVTSNTNYNEVDKTSFAYDKLLEIFHSLKSKRKVLILDTCYSGTGKSLLTEKAKIEINKQKGDYYQEDEVAEGEILIFSAQKNEPSLEDSNLGHSVYTNFLLEGFHKDLNNDGAVTISEAHLYARNMTREFTKNRQNPTAKIVIEGVDPIVVKGELRNSNVAYVYNRWTARSHYIVNVDGQFKGELDKGFSVNSGKHRIKITDTQDNKTITDRSIRFEGGKEYTIEDMIIFPDYPHLLDINIKTFSYTSSYVRDYYANKALYGIGIRYTHQDLWKTYDIGATLTIFQTVREDERTDSLAKMEQKREIYTFASHIGSRERISWLSTQNNRLQTNFIWGIGPSIMALKLQRTYSSPSGEAIEEHKTKRNFYPGVNSFIGSHIEVPSVNLRAGIDLEAGIWSSPFENSSSYIFTISPSVFVGYHW
ncbi:MAG: caspase family protein [Oligoflexia bacterium]|nr:caspase family protein [Oligoflexia bacterium]